MNKCVLHLFLAAVLLIIENEATLSQWIPSSSQQVRSLIRNQLVAAVQMVDYGQPIYSPTTRYDVVRQVRPHTVYGPPPVIETTSGGNNGYGPPINEYGPPSVTETTPGGNVYGPPPVTPETPGGSGYGPPINEYGPSNNAPNNVPNNDYGMPQTVEELSAEFPLDLGASERLKQSQFVQQLPHFNPPPQFRKLVQQQQQQRVKQQQAQRLIMKQKAKMAAAPIRQRPKMTTAPLRQNIQKRPMMTNNNRQQHQQQQLNRNNFNLANQLIFQQRLPQPVQLKQFARHENAPMPLYYTTPRSEFTTTESSEPNPLNHEDADVDLVDVKSVAIAGHYYILQQNGRLQRISYTTVDGKLIDGDITSDLNLEDVQPITAPLYSVNAFNQLIRIN